MFLLTVIKYLWIGFMIASLIILIVRDTSWIQYYKNINWKLILANIAVIVAMMFGLEFLMTISPKVMGFSIPKLIGILFKNAPDIPIMNINLLGYDVKYLGVILLLILLAALPKLAEFEENLFRRGTENWLDGLARSILFGLVHIFAFIPLGAAIILIIPGLFFTYLYFKGGVKLSTQAHFQHNLILAVILLISAIKNSFF